MTETHTLDVPGAAIVYDVHGPLPTADGRPPLLLIAQPMDASGFGALVQNVPERTVVTYDPRGLGRSTRSDGRTDNTPDQQAEDVHAVIGAVAAGPVELFASSGGAITALALVTAYPDDVSTLVAHEPPLLTVLPDADRAFAAERAIQDAYRAGGSGAGMAAFIALTTWQGELTDEYAEQPLPDPAAFGMSTEDDGSRGDPLLSGVSNPVTAYRPKVARLRPGRPGSWSPRASSPRRRSPGARRRLWPRSSAASWPSSPATTAGSWAASTATPASRKRSRRGSPRCFGRTQ